MDGNHGAGMAYLFLARNVRFVTEPTGDDLEEQELIHMSRVDVQRAMLDGHFKVLPWTTAIALALWFDDVSKGTSVHLVTTS